MFFKAAVLSNSGNVGKSMICESLLIPRIPNCELIKIETINSDGIQDEKLSAKEIDEIFSKIDVNDVCLLDIGASNIELFIQNMAKVEGAIEDLDFFFVPTTTAAKQQQDALNTITELMGMGVDPDCIKIIFNYCDPAVALEKQYKVIFDDGIAELLDLTNFDNQFCIEETQMFEFLAKTGVNYNESLNDTRDFKNLIRATKDKEERSLLSLEQMTHRYCKGFDKKFNDTFQKIKSACNLHFDDVEEIA
jgi:hypothetical protein